MSRNSVAIVISITSSINATDPAVAVAAAAATNNAASIAIFYCNKIEGKITEC